MAADGDETRGVSVVMRSVTKSYTSASGVRVDALLDVDVEVERGQLVAVTGPSGSGKSTLLHVLGAMDTIDSGEIVVGGLPVHSLGPKGLMRYRRSIGMVFQRFHLIPSLTALDNVLVPVIPQRPGRELTKRAESLLDRVGLASKVMSLPSQLSGGEQQRVAIARALIGTPGLVLADEPTGSLDSTNSEEIVRLLAELNREHGVTMVIATHDPGVAAHCERTLMMLDGRLDEASPAAALGGGRIPASEQVRE